LEVAANRVLESDCRLSVEKKKRSQKNSECTEAKQKLKKQKKKEESLKKQKGIVNKELTSNKIKLAREREVQEGLISNLNKKHNAQLAQQHASTSHRVIETESELKKSQLS
jgi:hypothetical protein